MRITALLLLSLALTCSAGDSMIDRRLREAVTAMASNPVPGAPSPLERGVRLLVTDGAMEDHFEWVMKQFAASFTQVGEPLSVEEVAVRAYGSRTEIAYFVIPCQRGAAFIRIVSVKRGDNQRIVSALAIEPTPWTVFPPGLLEPEPASLTAPRSR